MRYEKAKPPTIQAILGRVPRAFKRRVQRLRPLEPQRSDGRVREGDAEEVILLPFRDRLAEIRAIEDGGGWRRRVGSRIEQRGRGDLVAQEQRGDEGEELEEHLGQSEEEKRKRLFGPDLRQRQLAEQEGRKRDFIIRSLVPYIF
ncbi:hypothetical protein PVAG01_04487 [Phlyctema vagabunda]|uniref:Uncharacterized protein n=1 Tax=Phlyctema vagabunda TaxID=108571 RepID=A0ABR4PPC9_9HELO